VSIDNNLDSFYVRIIVQVQKNVRKQKPYAFTESLNAIAVLYSAETLSGAGGANREQVPSHFALAHQPSIEAILVRA